MSVNGNGTSSIDKGKAFNKAVAGSALSQRSASRAGKALTQQEKSGMVARAFKTASERTGAFKGDHAKK